jgi:hypothetical protein
MKPYVETHAIGVAWLLVGVTTGVIEITGYLRQRAEATRRDRGSLIMLRIRLIPGVILLGLSTKFAPAAEISQAPDPVPLVAALSSPGRRAHGRPRRRRRSAWRAA